MICRLFIDEVGNADLKAAASDPNVRYLSLTGIIMKMTAHERYTQPELDRIRAIHFPGLVTPPVLHRRDIVRREGPFAVLHDPHRRSLFDADILALVGKTPYIAITVTIDKQAHLARYTSWHYDPYHYCLQCLIERYVSWLERHGLSGDVVIEARFKKVDKRLKESFSRLWKDGTRFLPSVTVQKRLQSKEIGLYTKRDDVAGLQLADLLAHPSCRAMRAERDGLILGADFGSQVVEILKSKKYARDPSSGKIEGWGTKWLP